MNFSGVQLRRQTLQDLVIYTPKKEELREVGLR